jgi:NitT/TauT family transport system substrate-binding protein
MIRKLAAATMLLGTMAGTLPALALDKLKLAIGGKGLGESEISEVGKNKGIFAKHGLDLDIFYTAGSGETQQAVIAGSADIGVATGLLGVVGAYSKGAPLRVIGASFTGDSNLFWYVKADSPLKAPKDAAGHTVSYSTNGSSAHNVVLQMQKYLGVQFKPTATGTGPATLTQVMTGQVDVGWSGAPFGVAQVEKGDIRVLWRASDVPALAGQTSRVIIANAGFLASHKDLVQRYMDAYRETVDWVYSSDEGAKAYADWAGVPLGVAKLTLKDFVTKDAANPDKISDLKGVVAAAVDFKYIPKPLTDEQTKDLVQIPPRK